MPTHWCCSIVMTMVDREATEIEIKASADLLAFWKERHQFFLNTLRTKRNGPQWLQFEKDFSEAVNKRDEAQKRYDAAKAALDQLATQ